MKRSIIGVITLLALTLAGSSVAGPPLDGSYQSTDLGGSVLLGRYSESFTAAGGGLLPGVTFNSQSWNGTTLGTQWKYHCGTLVSAVLLVNNVNPTTGNGNRTYMKTFVGGYVWLSGTGPWANGDPDYPGIIDTYVEFETIQYTAWNPVAAVTNLQATAHFDNYPTSCMNFGIGNGSLVGTTDWGNTKPSTYPALLQQSTCDPVMTLGAWWNMMTITLTIQGCASPTENATWGAVKSMYSE